MPQQVRVGTRASALALTQTGHVADALAALGGLAVETVRVRTQGDRVRASLATIGGTGVFVTALRDALLDGRCDVAVHSLKDLPTVPADGLVIAAVPPRQDPRDALCARDGLTLATLPAGARVGTGSPRRAAQLRALRPDLDVVDIRGNVGTRLGRVRGLDPTTHATGAHIGAEAPHPGVATDAPRGDLDAVVLAAAGLARLGRLDAVSETLDPDVLAPAPGQGALAVEVRAADAGGDTALAAALRALDHTPTRRAVVAERAVLARLEAGCAAPIGAWGRLDETTGTLVLDAVVAAPDGSRVLRLAARGPADDDAAADALGRRLAEDLLDAGATDLAPLGPVR
ncbi:hydroxymethylbilane synthase [Cellulomonas sp. zg-ZUI199]|uniref:Porphobilinogen deaminase n=1 Tax=Cellulomonas wangleii TaxID=2816956 RepID=A0ABX8D424_9CELL|nr:MULTISPECIES: hydroxymethylbilane synthase [Cellulomonas]MBO0898799.1 hydroxymethylbilane synthase [Cellulomonas sp. zg-ZUI22]MBO0923913.1 hydroxymethylbilane synthase [Cellulomonas wangleii]MBO0924195.1 hydroxymethylbilane synthase [Cellulomonas wangleii]QVI62213.1 hydroxymethylbilane synthase [Cellulomonas wangleii]